MTTPNVVDVSEHQPTSIDFADLAANGIKAVIVRIGHGTTQDEHAASHIERAKAAGLFVHAYHFYEGVDGEVAWSIKNAQSLGIMTGTYYFLDMEGNISGSWSDIFRGFYRNWLMAGFKAGLYCSLSKYDLFNDKELKNNGVYRWIADWDVDEAPADADVWQYNCTTWLGQYQSKLDKDVDLTGKLIQAVDSPSHETDPNATYQVKAGAFVNFDYSTTSVAGGKMLVASPNGVDKLPKLGPDGDFIFNDHDFDHIWEGIKARIHLPSISDQIDWSQVIADNNIALKSDIPDLSGYALKKDIPSVDGFLKMDDLSGYAKLTDLAPYAKKADLSGYATKDDLDKVKTINISDQYVGKTPSAYADGFSREIKSMSVLGINRANLSSDAQSGSIALVETFSYSGYVRQTVKVLDCQRPMTFKRNGSGSSWYPWEVIHTTGGSWLQG